MLRLIHARLLDSEEVGRIASVTIENGVVCEIRWGESADKTPSDVDLRGCWLFPGLFDLHTHLRDFEESAKETIHTGACAAAHGGYTSICAMPNTQPPIDTPERLEHLLLKAEKEPIHIYAIGALTQGRAGRRLAELGLMQAKGAIAFSDDGDGVADPACMYHALQYAKQLGSVVIAHEEDQALSERAPLAEGKMAYQLGILGQPEIAETAMLARDLALVAQTGARLHVAHLSSATSVAMIRAAKRAGLPVTAEVTPHHLLLTEDACSGYAALAKVNPPLRTEADRVALWEGLRDGTIDAVATDHAPHTAAEKARGLVDAPFGAVGLETAFPLLFTYGVATGRLPLARLLDALTVAPARCLGLPFPGVQPGAPADLFLYDPMIESEVDPSTFLSRATNTPFAGWRCQGQVIATLCGGKIVYRQRSHAIAEALAQHLGEADVSTGGKI